MLPGYQPRRALSPGLTRPDAITPRSVTDSVVLVVSEFITNAIEHGHGVIELRLRAAGGTLTVSVTDENPAPAVLQQAGPDEISGRGMALVAALADRWGSSGEETWCEFFCDSIGSPT
ncbi:ATP-binding protein [Streptomyces tendae]|uniref:ATP-binding protein n=1 Tax=Streptomyces tendae TaxID=1932 RepID=UPI003719C779